MSASPATNDIVLVRRAFQTKAAKHAGWIGLATVIILAAVVWFVFLRVMPDDASILEKIGKSIEGKPWKLLEATANGLLVLFMALAIYIQRREKIVISVTGIAFKTPIPSWFPAFASRWTLPWTRIMKAKVRLPMGTAQPALFLSDGTKSRKILVNAWVKQGEEEAKQKPSIQDLFRYRGMPRAPSFEDMKVRLEASPLLQALRAHNVPIDYPGSAATGLTFDLQSSPRTNAAMIVFLGLLAYAFIDTLYIDEIYVGDYPLAIWVGAGLIAGVLARRWITDPKIPRVVSIGLAAMLGLGVAGALYPGLLRLNQWTDSTGLVAHDYVLRVYVRLVPATGDLPEVSFTRYSDYWGQFPLGSTHRLYLRHGGLGFYQLDEAPLLEAVRAYHEKKRPESRQPK
ncbi:MAG: hypothetical protein HY942_07900 [Gammaproteobacteria bacterium]|nr:hypothetical protein [Gammaproteobacteria bacterium]